MITIRFSNTRYLVNSMCTGTMLWRIECAHVEEDVTTQRYIQKGLLFSISSAHAISINY